MGKGNRYYKFDPNGLIEKIQVAIGHAYRQKTYQYAEIKVFYHPDEDTDIIPIINVLNQYKKELIDIPFTEEELDSRFERFLVDLTKLKPLPK